MCALLTLQSKYSIWKLKAKHWKSKCALCFSSKNLSAYLFSYLYSPLILRCSDSSHIGPDDEMSLCPMSWPSSLSPSQEIISSLETLSHGCLLSHSFYIQHRISSFPLTDHSIQSPQLVLSLRIRINNETITITKFSAEKNLNAHPSKDGQYDHLCMQIENLTKMKFIKVLNFIQP